MDKFGVRFTILSYSETRLYENSDLGVENVAFTTPSLSLQQKPQIQNAAKADFLDQWRSPWSIKHFLFFNENLPKYVGSIDGPCYKIMPNTLLMRTGMLGTWYCTLRVHLVDGTNWMVQTKEYSGCFQVVLRSRTAKDCWCAITV